MDTLKSCMWNFFLSCVWCSSTSKMLVSFQFPFYPSRIASLSSLHCCHLLYSLSSFLHSLPVFVRLPKLPFFVLFLSILKTFSLHSQPSVVLFFFPENHPSTLYLLILLNSVCSLSLRNCVCLCMNTFVLIFSFRTCELVQFFFMAWCFGVSVQFLVVCHVA